MCCESTELLEVYHLLPLDLQCPRTLLFKCTVLFPGYESVEVDFFVVVIVVVFFFHRAFALFPFTPPLQ